MPFLTGQAKQSPRQEFGYFNGDLQGLRVGSWKLREVDGKTELFDLQTDPGEQYNRAETEPAVVQRIRTEMRQLAQETNAPLSEPNK